MRHVPGQGLRCHLAHQHHAHSSRARGLLQSAQNRHDFLVVSEMLSLKASSRLSASLLSD